MHVFDNVESRLSELGVFNVSDYANWFLERKFECTVIRLTVDSFCKDGFDTKPCSSDYPNPVRPTCSIIRRSANYLNWDMQEFERLICKVVSLEMEP